MSHSLAPHIKILHQQISDSIKQWIPSEHLTSALHLLHKATGRICTTGIGKSGHCASLLASSLRSLSWKAEFIHSTEALHGDAGSLRGEDVIIFFSHSGKTRECLELADYADTLGLRYITITSNPKSPLARMSHTCIDYPPNELCQFNRAPSLSLIYMTLISQLISMSLQRISKQTEHHYLSSHPAGALGQDGRRVGHVCIPLSDTAHVTADTSVQDTLLAMQAEQLGAAIITEQGKVLGMFTDGDVRRAILKGAHLDDPIKQWMSQTPKTVRPDQTLAEVRRLFCEHKISSAPVCSDEGLLLGMITHLILEGTP